MMQRDEQGEFEELRVILLEVAETLEAVIIALQAERGDQEASYVIREAVRRVVQLRQHLDALDAQGA
ncbi:MAG: hypothetical protein AMXMBFR80_10390 [Dehalococcoidia bacterium]|jgi:hypothetical protein|nr:hypothetical protein [Tepidiformaceae bacterium]